MAGNPTSGQLPLNQYLKVFTSAARTATVSSDNQANLASGSAIVCFDVTAGTSGFGVTLSIEGFDEASGKYNTILAGSQVGTVSTVYYKVDRDLTASANSIAKDLMPKVFRITVTHADTKSVTYSVGVNLIP